MSLCIMAAICEIELIANIVFFKKLMQSVANLKLFFTLVTANGMVAGYFFPTTAFYSGETHVHKGFHSSVNFTLIEISDERGRVSGSCNALLI